MGGLKSQGPLYYTSICIIVYNGHTWVKLLWDVHFERRDILPKFANQHVTAAFKSVVHIFKHVYVYFMTDSSTAVRQQMKEERETIETGINTSVLYVVPAEEPQESCSKPNSCLQKEATSATDCSTCDRMTYVTPVKKRKVAKGTSITPPKSIGVQMTPIRRKSKSCSFTQRKRHVSVGPGAPLLADKCVGDTVCVADKGVQVDSPALSIDAIRDSDKEIKNYTGLNSYSLFSILHKYLVAKCDDDECDVQIHSKDPAKQFTNISTANQLLLVLVKLRKNFTEQCLGKLFGVSQACVCAIFHFWIQLMFRKFKILKLCPSLVQMREHMPENVKCDYPNLREIYDGTEMKIQKPSDPLVQRQMWF